MENGFQRIGDNEARYVRDGHIQGDVKLDTSGTSTVIVTQYIYLESFDSDLTSVFESKVQELEDTANSIRHCAFCAKTDAEVTHLIAGPTTYICNECVDMCSLIIEDN